MSERNFLCLVDAGKEWLGGVYYVRNIMKTLAAASWIRDVKIHVLVREEFAPIFEPLKLEFPKFQIHVRKNQKSLISRVITFFSKRVNRICDLEISKVSRKTRADFIFPVGSAPLLCCHGTQVHWIPDFQHLYFPENFSLSERRTRNSLYSALAKGTNPLILSSHSALDDWNRCQPAAQGKAYVLPFISDIEDEISKLTPSFETEVLSSLGLSPSTYFYVPNQFWPHKNHAIILDALEILKSQGKHLPKIVCTGNLSNSTGEDYSTNIKKRIEALLSPSPFMILSTLRRPQQIVVMKNALAILQPSLFEGWNTGIQEAKRLGKHLIASALPVHHEQCRKNVHFFDPHSASELAELLALPCNTLSSSIADPIKEQELDAQQYAEGVRSLFGSRNFREQDTSRL